MHKQIGIPVNDRHSFSISPIASSPSLSPKSNSSRTKSNSVKSTARIPRLKLSINSSSQTNITNLSNNSVPQNDDLSFSQFKSLDEDDEKFFADDDSLNADIDPTLSETPLPSLSLNSSLNITFNRNKETTLNNTRSHSPFPGTISQLFFRMVSMKDLTSPSIFCSYLNQHDTSASPPQTVLSSPNGNILNNVSYVPVLSILISLYSAIQQNIYRCPFCNTVNASNFQQNTEHHEKCSMLLSLYDISHSLMSSEQCKWLSICLLLFQSFSHTPDLYQHHQKMNILLENDVDSSFTPWVLFLLHQFFERITSSVVSPKFRDTDSSSSIPSFSQNPLNFLYFKSLLLFLYHSMFTNSLNNVLLSISVCMDILPTITSILYSHFQISKKETPQDLEDTSPSTHLIQFDETLHVISNILNYVLSFAEKEHSINTKSIMQSFLVRNGAIISFLECKTCLSQAEQLLNNKLQTRQMTFDYVLSNLFPGLVQCALSPPFKLLDVTHVSDSSHASIKTHTVTENTREKRSTLSENIKFQTDSNIQSQQKSGSSFSENINSADCLIYPICGISSPLRNALSFLTQITRYSLLTGQLQVEQC